MDKNIELPNIIDLSEHQKLLEEEEDISVLVCGECESEEFTIYGNGAIVCADCGTEIAFEACMIDEEEEM